MGCVAGRGGGTEAGQDADHRSSGGRHACGREPAGRRSCECLGELGWIEGRTVAIEYRWAEGRSARLAEIAVEFVGLNVDVVLATGTAPAFAAKQATSVIPIVFAFAGDPVGTGLVASLTRPGGNVTGMSNQATDLAAKRIELLREILPRLRKLAVMANIAYPAAVLEMSEVQVAARTLGIEVSAFDIRESKDIAPAFEALKSQAEALFLVGDPLMTANRTRVTALALAAQVPTIYVHGEYVAAGGLISYGANFPDLFRRAAEVVDKINGGQSRPTSLSSSRPSSIWSLTSQPPRRSASMCRRHCSPALTR